MTFLVVMSVLSCTVYAGIPQAKMGCAKEAFALTFAGLAHAGCVHTDLSAAHLIQSRTRLGVCAVAAVTAVTGFDAVLKANCCRCAGSAARWKGVVCLSASRHLYAR